MESCKPRLALVTGAGSGIGRATALRCNREGYSVIAVDIDSANVSATATECGAGAFWYCADVGDAEATTALARSVRDEHGPVDLLINNAGVGLVGPFLDSYDEWNWIRSVNLDGVINSCFAFGEAMTQRGSGQVVNVASGLAFLANRRMPYYCATKAAVVKLSECLRADWARHGVGVSVVCPGVTNTGITAATRVRGLPADEHERLLGMFRRARSADTVAKAIMRTAARNKSVVPVSPESIAAYYAMRWLPEFARELVDRA